MYQITQFDTTSKQNKKISGKTVINTLYGTILYQSEKLHQTIKKNPTVSHSIAYKKYTTLKNRIKKFSIYTQPEEYVLKACRQHWFTNVKSVLLVLLLTISPIVLLIIGLPPVIPAKYYFVAYLFWYLVSAIIALEKFMNWFFDDYIITNMRVISIELINLIDKKLCEADISSIQDVTTRITGISQTIFNYGTVVIQTAASTDEIVFKNIRNPEGVAKRIECLRQLGIVKKGGGLNALRNTQ